MSAALLQAVLDAVASPLLILDGRVEVRFANVAARRQFEIRGRFSPVRAGELLRCVNAVATPEGCGGSAACRACLVRRSVQEALKTLVPVRERVELRQSGAGEGEARRLLLTASPFELDGERLVLLTLEDVRELLELRGLLPVCASCLKPRDDPEFWHSAERYLSSHIMPDASLGRCPACAGAAGARADVGGRGADAPSRLEAQVPGR